jgi:hypothetical protein
VWTYGVELSDGLCNVCTFFKVDKFQDFDYLYKCIKQYNIYWGLDSQANNDGYLCNAVSGNVTVKIPHWCPNYSKKAEETGVKSE